MTYRLKAAIYILIITTCAAISLISNTWSLLNLKTSKYFVNPTLLSGTLLLYDRPFFFETREIEVKKNITASAVVLPFDLSLPGYNSYLHRRLFRFATDDFNCGINSAAAFKYLFCESNLSILQNIAVAEVTVKYTPHVSQGKPRQFHQVCK